MAYKFVGSRQLKCLLNDAEQKQKKDIFDYTGGHLNAASLKQPAEILAQQRGWKTSALEPDVTASIESERSPNKRFQSKRQDMSEVLYQFSVGTTGSVPNIKRKSTAPQKLLYLRDINSKNSASKDGKKGYIEDSVFIEELDNQELYMPSARSYTSVDGVEDIQEDKSPTKTFQPTNHHDKPPFRNNFLPVQTAGITKQDQYRSSKMFESNIINKKASLEQKVLSGNQAVVHHENNLKQGLSTMKFRGHGPNFHRLQVYSNVFEDIVDESPIFQHILRNVKTAYDAYISKLLDTQTAKHQLLHDQIEQMTESGTSKPKQLQQIKNNVDDMELEGKWLLEENDRLREALREEGDLFSLAPEQELLPKKMSVFKDDIPAELTEELEHYKALILEKLDALKSLRTALRDDHVPLTVCTHLEQCIKETEIEVQKLLKQNEYFEKSIADMEHDLKEAIIDADTSEKDARRIWRKINSTRAQPGEDDEDEGKWNWYIS
ncbi:uncharacterized protein LOC126812042 [Patella vulgata]|uniref:uncharacterized protein LOC126812042 n=1 Tax=Patella vulgata TaxID=6465 RepID=UPI0024A82ABE|nr:uncharacterized protein LOC126812042 [Patella vulgata]